MRFVRNKFHILTVLLGAAALLSTPARAQQQQPDQEQQGQTSAPAPNTPTENPAQPIPAIRSPLAGINGNDDDQQNPQKIVPDTTPLSGVEPINSGRPALDHNYIQPQFKVFSIADSDSLSASGNSGGWGDFTSFLGGIDLHDASGISNLTLSYLGGGTIAIGGDASSSTLHQLNVEEDLTWHRIKLSFIDQFAFLPEASFGYAGLGGGVALPGGGSIGLQPGLTPGDSILTTRGNRATNSFLTQADIYLTPRASITVAGGYSLLHYFDNDLVDFGDTIFQAGYNYQLTRKDTVAVFYRFSGYRYSGFNQSINDNSFQASYGRRVTGRFSFQIQGGPDVTFVTTPLTTATTTAPASGGQMRELYWSLSTSANYQLQRVSLNASYTHGVSGGSGVLLGGIADTVSGGASRQLTRQLNGGVTAGYSRNKGINALATAGAAPQSFGYVYGGFNLDRTLGRALDLNFNYQVQHQTSNEDFCIGTTCNQNLTRHQITVGLNWHRQPIAF
jgi:hypothetical protein